MPIATSAISEATVFIGICTAASSDMLSGFLLINYFDQSQSLTFLKGQQIISQILQQIFLHFSTIFFLLYFVEKFISVFCSPLTTIFYIPFISLHFPIRNIIFHCERRYIPYTSIIWLCCKIAIV